MEEVMAGLDAFESIPIQEAAVDLKAALKLSGRHDIYAYDAYYLDLALKGGMPILTLDGRMAGIADKEGIKVKEIS